MGWLKVSPKSCLSMVILCRTCVIKPIKIILSKFKVLKFLQDHKIYVFSSYLFSWRCRSLKHDLESYQYKYWQDLGWKKIICYFQFARYLPFLTFVNCLKLTWNWYTVHYGPTFRQKCIVQNKWPKLICTVKNRQKIWDISFFLYKLYTHKRCFFLPYHLQGWTR